MKIAITIDDPHCESGAYLEPLQRDQKIREALKEKSLQACLFVCARRIMNESGSKLLSAWSSERHLLGNHTFSHLNLNSENTSIKEYAEDIARCHEVIKSFPTFTNLFRYPFLKGGNTISKRNEILTILKKYGYRQGYVSIDASDWCIDQRLEAALKLKSDVQLTPYKDFYLSHMRERAIFYNSLALAVFDRPINHTLLIHHNLLNALFLKDLLEHFIELGWELINAEEAYKDPVYNNIPDIVPFGESIIWAEAKKQGHHNHLLRYPAEDESYERSKMDAMRL